MSLADAQRAAFQARIRRIEGGTRGHAPAGPDARARGASRRSRGARSLRTALVLPVAMLGTLALGALAALSVRYAGFQANAHDLMPALTGRDLFAAEAVTSFAIILIVRLLFGLTGPLALIVMVSGGAAILLGLHNAVHANPGFFAAIFSADWTAQTMADNPARTLNLAGQSFPL